MQFEKIDYYRKNSMDVLLKNRTPNTKQFLKAIALASRIFMTLSPLLTNGRGEEYIIYAATFVISLTYLVKMAMVLNIKGIRYLAYPDTCVDMLSLFGVLFSSAATLYFNA